MHRSTTGPSLAARMGAHRLGRWFAGASALVALGCANAPPLRAPRAVPCDADVPAHANCYLLSVPEDHARPGDKRIGLAIVVSSARQRVASADPVLVLLGGPGDAASRRYAANARAHETANDARDVVFVDQRGTGRSAPLSCAIDDALQSYMDVFLPSDAGSRCAAAMGDSTDVTRYRTADFVADLELVREALGVERWNLHGTSYGTRVALQYAARHPDRVRSAVLVGVVPPQMVMPEPFGDDADRALAMLIAECGRDAQCASAFPRLAAEIDSLRARLARAPAPVVVTHPAAGHRERVLYSRGALGETVRAAMYSPLGAAALPLEVHEAYRGDYGALATSHLRRQWTIASEGWAGLYLAATCPEDIARLDAAPAIARNEGTILSASRVRQHVTACQGWPARKERDTWPEKSTVAAPVLMIVGERDPVTPPRWAEMAREHAANSALVVVPYGGHGFAGLRGLDCITRIKLSFYDNPDPTGVDKGCLTDIVRPPFIVRR